MISSIPKLFSKKTSYQPFYSFSKAKKAQETNQTPPKIDSQKTNKNKQEQKENKQSNLLKNGAFFTAAAAVGFGIFYYLKPIQNKKFDYNKFKPYQDSKASNLRRTPFIDNVFREYEDQGIDFITPSIFEKDLPKYLLSRGQCLILMNDIEQAQESLLFALKINTFQSQNLKSFTTARICEELSKIGMLKNDQKMIEIFRSTASKIYETIGTAEEDLRLNEIDILKGRMTGESIQATQERFERYFEEREKKLGPNDMGILKVKLRQTGCINFPRNMDQYKQDVEQIRKQVKEQLNGMSAELAMEIYFELATAYRMLKDHSTAKEIFKEGLELRNKMTSINEFLKEKLVHLGFHYANYLSDELQQPEEAIQTYEKTIELSATIEGYEELTNSIIGKIALIYDISLQNPSRANECYEVYKNNANKLNRFDLSVPAAIQQCELQDIMRKKGFKIKKGDTLKRCLNEVHLFSIEKLGKQNEISVEIANTLASL